VSEQVRRKLKVAMQENARLQAEVERLNAEVDLLVHKVNCWRIVAETKEGKPQS